MVCGTRVSNFIDSHITKNSIIIFCTGIPLPDNVDDKPLEELEIAETKQKTVRHLYVLLV